jgi:hypothetical protein
MACGILNGTREREYAPTDPSSAALILISHALCTGAFPTVDPWILIMASSGIGIQSFTALRQVLRERPQSISHDAERCKDHLPGSRGICGPEDTTVCCYARWLGSKNTVINHALGLARQ